MQLFSVIPQDLRTVASPEFAGETITGNSVFGLNSSVFQPAAGGDSTTFFQIKNAAGTQVVGVDTSNERVMIGAGSPNTKFQVVMPTAYTQSDMEGIFIERTGDAGAGNYGGALILSGPVGFGNIQKGVSIVAIQEGADSDRVGLTFNIHGAAGADPRVEAMRIDEDGNIGFGESSPETLLELTHAQPWYTGHCKTHSNDDDSGLVKWIAKREDGAGTETESFSLEVSHDGAGVNDQLTKAILKVNTGSGLVEGLRLDRLLRLGIATTPTARLHLPAGGATAGLAPLKLTSGTDLTTPEAGVIEYDGTHYSITEVVDRRVISVASDSLTTAVTVASTTDETTVFTASISANELHVGKVLRIEGAGQASTHDAADTITVRIKIGTTVLTSLAMVPGQAADDCLHFYNIITIRTTGAGGTIASHGHIQIADSEIHENDEDVALDTTAAEDITVTFQWNDANAGNTATLDQCFLEILV